MCPTCETAMNLSPRSRGVGLILFYCMALRVWRITKIGTGEGVALIPRNFDSQEGKEKTAYGTQAGGYALVHLQRLLFCHFAFFFRFDLDELMDEALFFLLLLTNFLIPHRRGETGKGKEGKEGG